MPPILESLIPVFLTIMLGWGVRMSGAVTQDHWQGLERVTYYVLIPALVITTLAMADLRNVPILSVGLSLFVPTLILGLCIFAARPLLERRFGIGGRPSRRCCKAPSAGTVSSRSPSRGPCMARMASR